MQIYFEQVRASLRAFFVYEGVGDGDNMKHYIWLVLFSKLLKWSLLSIFFLRFWSNAIIMIVKEYMNYIDFIIR